MDVVLLGKPILNKDYMSKLKSIDMCSFTTYALIANKVLNMKLPYDDEYIPKNGEVLYDCLLKLESLKLIKLKWDE
ncbi:hypothetical protein [Companilactobacillus futsaii]|uniref:Uncharacterized protein n=2 Tax=Companilactobacillus futsaii TaxID=938155 RepID=A0A5B7T127_9LACO|nr:hypothetical protein [Companilactobacillus futsaii]KRK95072.1 hypothetical protein FC88_GL002464 [Companilactobacillus futsaii JCM 17355]QCX25747.1 hypothetical protein FG051_11885 [Companilactobacillus futsaii]